MHIVYLYIYMHIIFTHVSGVSPITYCNCITSGDACGSWDPESRPGSCTGFRVGFARLSVGCCLLFQDEITFSWSFFEAWPVWA